MNCIGGLVVKLAVAILTRTVSASPGFDSRPMQQYFLPLYCSIMGKIEWTLLIDLLLVGRSWDERKVGLFNEQIVLHHESPT